jgi:hypothetical protein
MEMPWSPSALVRAAGVALTWPKRAILTGADVEVGTG